uniref:SH2 domain-containing protein n=1 Tax=Mesocestoides corti TaxID=53468 RepID=A0A5K3EL45_MESCO
PRLESKFSSQSFSQEYNNQLSQNFSNGYSGCSQNSRDSAFDSSQPEKYEIFSQDIERKTTRNEDIYLHFKYRVNTNNILLRRFFVKLAHKRIEAVKAFTSHFSKPDAAHSADHCIKNDCTVRNKCENTSPVHSQRSSTAQAHSKKYAAFIKGDNSEGKTPLFTINFRKGFSTATRSEARESAFNYQRRPNVRLQESAQYSSKLPNPCRLRYRSPPKRLAQSPIFTTHPNPCKANAKYLPSSRLEDLFCSDSDFENDGEDDYSCNSDDCINLVDLLEIEE